VRTWRRLLVRSLVGAANLLQRAGRLLACTGAGALTRAELDESIRREWDEYGRSSWVSRPALNDWERAFYVPHLAAGKRALLVGCGSGRDLAPLLKEGFSVDGIDLAPEAIALGRQNLARLGLQAELFVGRIEDALLPRAYDVVLFSWFVYGYIPGRAARIGTLAGIREALVPEGRVLVSCIRRDPRESRIPIALARVVSRLTRSDWRPELGDHLDVWKAGPQPAIHFEHRFDEDEIRGEVEAAGLRVVAHDVADDGRLVLGR
jgi:SAM-dependent methyltransferase